MEGKKNDFTINISRFYIGFRSETGLFA